jgi:hypothetical protein
MGDANFTKLLSPELIPEPLRNSGVDVEHYTKKLYDYLRRLTSSLAIGISQNIIGSADELVKVSSDDTTARTLEEKITSVDGSVTITELNEAGDELLDLSVGGPRILDKWLRATANTTKSIIDGRDWRGMFLRISVYQVTGSIAVANVNEWSPGSPEIWTGVIGSAYPVGGGDVLTVACAANGSNFVLGIEEGSGNVFVTVSGYSSEVQYRCVVEGFTRKTTSDQTV